MGSSAGAFQRPRRRGGLAVSKLALFAMALALLSALMLLAAGLGNRWGLWEYRMAFRLLGWAAWGGLAGGLLSLAAIIWAGLRRSRRGMLVALVGLLAGTLAFGVQWQMRQRAKEVPPIHDITTDTDNPPRFVAVAALRRDTPAGVEYAGAKIAGQQKRAYADIVPLALNLAPADAFARCLGAARSLGWEIDAAVPEEGRIEATDTTMFFGFKDDIVVRITRTAAGSRVDVRSASRVGRSDLGTNAKRVRAFLRAVAQENAQEKGSGSNYDPK